MFHKPTQSVQCTGSMFTLKLLTSCHYNYWAIRSTEHVLPPYAVAKVFLTCGNRCKKKMNLWSWSLWWCIKDSDLNLLGVRLRFLELNVINFIIFLDTSRNLVGFDILLEGGDVGEIPRPQTLATNLNLYKNL